jgi:LmbE family N-acetylglucosaminyl deacetylase
VPPAPADLQVLVLSPHLDDAALSCGGLLTTLPPGTAATVVTFFTTPGPSPVLMTRSARTFLRLSGFGGDVAELFEARRAEDLRALSPHADVVHAGLTDAMFRRRAGAALLGPLARALPELVHVYPTYRFGVAAGRVARADRGCLEDVAGRVRRWVAQAGPCVVLAPLGIGGHVDHVLVRDAACRAVPAERLGFYADYPYVLEADPDPAFVAARGLSRVGYAAAADRKRDLVREYVTQAAALYPAGVPEVPDDLWWGPGTGADVAALRRVTG